MHDSPVTDQHGRQVNYMRISVTDRCNLRCRYCMSGRIDYISHSNILRYEEIQKLVDTALELDVGKIRLTGGEPFARKGFLNFVQDVYSRHPDLDLRITTNGTLIRKYIPTLRQAGIKRLNISLDTLDRAKFQLITGADLYHEVRKAIDECLEQGIKVKVNTVAMKGMNDDEMDGFINFARTMPIDLRFIEFMPVGQAVAWSEEMSWKFEEILGQANKYCDLIPVVAPDDRHGTARMYAIGGGMGRLGIISPLSQHFCGSCNRLRITSSGKLRTCLFSDKTYRLKPLIRNPKLGIDAVKKVIRLAGEQKPIGHDLLKKRKENEAICLTRMSAIGG